MAPEPLVACTEKSPGVVIVGAVVSGGGVTVTVKLFVAGLPARSTALHVIVCGPMPSVDPVAGSQLQVSRSLSGSSTVTV